MENFFPRKWKTDIFSHCVRTSDSVWEWNGNGNLFRLYWQECMKCCKSALLTECFSTVLDSLWGSPNSLLLFELLQPTLSHYRYTYSIVVEKGTTFLIKQPLRNPYFSGCKSPPNVSDSSNMWIFSLLSTTQESVWGLWFTARLCDSELECTVRAAAAAAAAARGLGRTKGQRLTNRTPAPEPLSESAFEPITSGLNWEQVQPQGLLLIREVKGVCWQWLIMQ